MGLIKLTLSMSLTAIMFTGCSARIASKSWEVTALNGDKMIGCIAADVTPDLQGYYDFTQFENLTLETFQALKIQYSHDGRDVTRNAFVDLTNYQSVELVDPQKARQKCDQSPSQNWTAKYRSTRYGKTDNVFVEYYIYEREGKIIFVDAYTYSKKDGVD